MQTAEKVEQLLVISAVIRLAKQCNLEMRTGAVFEKKRQSLSVKCLDNYENTGSKKVLKDDKQKEIDNRIGTFYEMVEQC